MPNTLDDMMVRGQAAAAGGAAVRTVFTGLRMSPTLRTLLAAACCTQKEQL